MGVKPQKLVAGDFWLWTAVGFVFKIFSVLSSCWGRFEGFVMFWCDVASQLQKGFVMAFRVYRKSWGHLQKSVFGAPLLLNPKILEHARTQPVKPLVPRPKPQTPHPSFRRGLSPPRQVLIVWGFGIKVCSLGIRF